MQIRKNVNQKKLNDVSLYIFSYPFVCVCHISVFKVQFPDDWTLSFTSHNRLHVCSVRDFQGLWCIFHLTDDAKPTGSVWACRDLDKHFFSCPHFFPHSLFFPPSLLFTVSITLLIVSISSSLCLSKLIISATPERGWGVREEGEDWLKVDDEGLNRETSSRVGYRSFKGKNSFTSPSSPLLLCSYYNFEQFTLPLPPHTCDPTPPPRHLEGRCSRFRSERPNQFLCSLLLSY